MEKDKLKGIAAILKVVFCGFESRSFLILLSKLRVAPWVRPKGLGSFDMGSTPVVVVSQSFPGFCSSLMVKCLLVNQNLSVQLWLAERAGHITSALLPGGVEEGSLPSGGDLEEGGATSWGGVSGLSLGNEPAKTLASFIVALFREPFV